MKKKSKVFFFKEVKYNLIIIDRLSPNLANGGEKSTLKQQRNNHIAY